MSYLFKFEATLDMGWIEQGQSTSASKLMAGIETFAAVYALKLEQYETTGFDHQFQKETFCIGVTLSREIMKFRNGYNLLKICEASLDLLEGCEAASIVHREYSLNQLK